MLAGVSLPAQLPLAMDYVGDTLAVVTDAGVYFYSSDLAPIGSMPFGGKQLGRYLINGDGLIISLTNNNSDHRSDIYVFDKNGQQVYYTNIQADVLDISLGEGKGWALARQGLYGFELGDGVITFDNTVQGSGLEYIAYGSRDGALLCSDTSARFVKPAEEKG